MDIFYLFNLFCAKGGPGGGNDMLIKHNLYIFRLGLAYVGTNYYKNYYSWTEVAT